MRWSMNVGLGRCLREAEKGTHSVVLSAGLGPGCWVLSDPNRTSYFLLWTASHSMLIWWVRQRRPSFSGGKVPFPSAFLQVTVLD